MTDKLHEIPLIDIAPLVDPLTGPVGERGLAYTVRAIHDSLRDIGFLYVSNHGVPESLQTELLRFSRHFFAADLSFKMSIAMEKAGHAWRGYFPVGGELTSGRPDQKEGLYFGKELNANHPAVARGIPLHGANQWPSGEEYRGFKDVVLSYMDHMTELGQSLMEAVALGLGLPRDYFRRRFTDEPTTLFRIFNYPKHVWESEDDEWGVREHTDMGFLTILRQDSSGGLQVKARDGRWIQAPPLDGTFVINIGDMLEVWTHGLYRATPHRVRNAGQGDRLSLPFFFDPNWNSTLESIDPALLPLEQTAAGASSAGSSVEPSVARRWDGLNLRHLPAGMTYGDFVWSKVEQVFPGLSR